MALLSIKDVSKYYGDYQALKSISLDVNKGSIFGLLGPNGAGKTSLIRIINQITAPDEGLLLLNGEKLNLSHISRIGYLPEERGLYPKMKVGEQVLYLARLKNLGNKEAMKRIKYWFDRFDIGSWWNKNIEELSKGMAQKVQFIATVIHNPDLLIFDEPFTGFDPINTNLIKNEIRRLRDEGATIIFSTHRMDSVEEICDHIALINKSEKILEGPIKEIKNTYKNNIYKLELEGIFNSHKLSPDFNVMDQKEIDGSSHLRISVANQNTNDLLLEVSKQGRLISFKEEIPSLDDIFIQKVEHS